MWINLTYVTSPIREHSYHFHSAHNGWFSPFILRVCCLRRVNKRELLFQACVWRFWYTFLNWLECNIGFHFRVYFIINNFSFLWIANNQFSFIMSSTISKLADSFLPYKWDIQSCIQVYLVFLGLVCYCLWCWGTLARGESTGYTPKFHNSKGLLHFPALFIFLGISYLLPVPACEPVSLPCPCPRQWPLH